MLIHVNAFTSYTTDKNEALNEAETKSREKSRVYSVIYSYCDTEGAYVYFVEEGSSMVRPAEKIIATYDNGVRS